MNEHSFADLVASGVLEIGDGYRAKSEELGGDGPIFLRGGLLEGEEIRFEGAERFHSALKAQLASKLSQPFDVVITTKGWSTGRTTFMLPEYPEVVYSPHLSFWRSRARDVLDPHYLRQWARSKGFSEQLAALAGTCTLHPYLSLGSQLQLRITLPPIDEQRRISLVLSSMDAKIQVNRQMNETLEEIARAVFKSWFVDFDPVRAKAEGRQPEGMDAETAALFPSRLVESELGPIPEGWQVETLKELVKMQKGVSYRSSDLGPSPVALVNLKNFARGGGFRRDGFKEYAGQWKETEEVLPGDVIVAQTDVTQAAEVIGRVARVPSGLQYERLVISLDVVSIRPASMRLSREFLAPLLAQQRFVDHALAHTNGTTVLHLASRAIPEYRAVIPPSALVEKYTAFTLPLLEKSDLTAQESQTLAALRDLLLPKLISGELRIPNAERLVSEAT